MVHGTIQRFDCFTAVGDSRFGDITDLSQMGKTSLQFDNARLRRLGRGIYARRAELVCTVMVHVPSYMHACGELPEAQHKDQQQMNVFVFCHRMIIGVLAVQYHIPRVEMPKI